MVSLERIRKDLCLLIEVPNGLSPMPLKSYYIYKKRPIKISYETAF